MPTMCPLSYTFFYKIILEGSGLTGRTQLLNQLNQVRLPQPKKTDLIIHSEKEE